MKTWYLMGQVTKRPELPTHIREGARRLGCLQDLESIRFEKNWNRQRNGHPVYCGIGFADTRPEGHTSPPEPPFDAEMFVETLGITLVERGNIRRSILPAEQAEPFTQESLMSGETVVHVNRRPPPDPAEIDSAWEFAHSDAGGSTDEMVDQYDKLLAWLSCAATGTWGHFVEATRSLGILNHSRPGDVLVRMMLLGHIEIDADGRRWSVNPPMLCESSGGDWYLCGQRDAGLLGLLYSRANAEVAVQPHGAGPGRVAVTAERRNDAELLFEEAGAPLQLVESVGARIAGSLPSGEEWIDSVKGNTCPDLVDSSVQRISFESGELEPVRPVAREDGGLNVPEGVYLVTTEQGQGRSFRAYCHGDGSWTRCDWYGMAYIEQRRAGRLDAFFTDEGIVLPSNGSWPRLYERAMVLSSGLLPVHIPARGRLFETCDLAVTETLAKKLGVDLQPLKESEQ